MEGEVGVGGLYVALEINQREEISYSSSFPWTFISILRLNSGCADSNSSMRNRLFRGIFDRT